MAMNFVVSLAAFQTCCIVKLLMAKCSAKTLCTSNVTRTYSTTDGSAAAIKPFTLTAKLASKISVTAGD